MIGNIYLVICNLFESLFEIIYKLFYENAQPSIVKNHMWKFCFYYEIIFDFFTNEILFVFYFFRLEMV